MPVPLLLLLLVLLLPGYAAFFGWGRKLGSSVTAFELIYLLVIASIALVSVPAMLLAQASWFSLPVLLSMVVLASLLVVSWGIKNGRSLNIFSGLVWDKPFLIALALLSAAVVLSPKPFEYLVGGRDHGIYVNTGIQLARTGRLLIENADLAALPAESRAVLTNPTVTAANEPVPGPWSEGQWLPGLTIRDANRGVVLPHAFHLYPVWIGILFALGGVSWALYTTTLFGLLGTLGIYFVAARLFGKPVALLTLFLSVLQVTQMWFNQYPSAEILIRLFFWAGLLLALLMLETENGLTAVLAGFCFGLIHLTKMDTIFIPILLLLFFAYLWFSLRFQRSYWTFVVTYLLVSLYALFHALFFATIYTIDQLTRVILPDFAAARLVQAADGYAYPLDILTRLLTQNWAAIAPGLFFLGVLLWLSHQYRQMVARGFIWLKPYHAFLRALLALGIGTLVFYTTLLVTIFQPVDFSKIAATMTQIGWYLSAVGLFLGTVGMMLVLVTGDNGRFPRPFSFALLLLLGNTAPFLILGSGTYPDQFWAVRRFIPVVIPTFTLFVAVLMGRLMPTQRQDWANAFLPVALLLVLAWSFAQPTIKLAELVEFEGLYDQIVALNAQFPENAVLLFDGRDGDVAQKFSLPLWSLYGRTVFIAEPGELMNPGLETAVSAWEAADRDVYWLAGLGADLPEWPDLSADYLNTQTISAPLAEGSYDHIPAQSGTFFSTMDIYALHTGQEVSDEVETLLTAWEVDDAYVTGLYSPDYLPGLPPRRWASGEVLIAPGLNELPDQILLLVGNGRSPDNEQPIINVFINDTLVDSFSIRTIQETHIINIPAELPTNGFPFTLRLETNPWVPAQTGYNTDTRELGYFLDWVKLIYPKTIPDTIHN